MMSSSIVLSFLGAPKVSVQGTVWPGFHTSKALALLCYLALTPYDCTREALAGIFWPDTPENNARASLGKALSDLRTPLGERLTISRRTVSVRLTSRDRLDITDFELCIGANPKHASIEDLERAISLYQGQFLDGFHLRNAPDFEQWILLHRQRLADLHFTAGMELAERLVETTSFGSAIDVLRQLLAHEPWREEAHRLLMIGLARAGQRSAALAQYQLCRTALASELGVEPAESTVHLAEQIRTQALFTATPVVEVRERTTTSSPPKNLPEPLTPFIGRESELEALESLLARPDCRLLTIVGIGGVGKTRLSLALAQRRAIDFADGVFFVDLSGTSDPASIASAIAYAIDLPLQGSKEPQEQLAAHLHARALLLVLDNVEHLLPNLQPVSALLSRAPGVKIIATSREPLQLYGEWLYRLAGLRTPLAGDDVDFLAYDAIRLFMNAMARARSGAEASYDEVVEASGIARILEGLPLGIELAAAWTRHMDCASVLRIVEQDLHALSLPYTDIPARHQSLWAVMDHSWHQLSDEEKRVMRALSVFRGEFYVAAAIEIAETSPDLLVMLADKSLVMRADEERYRLHEIVRQYADKQAHVAGDFETVRNRHSAYYLALAEVSDREILGPAQFEWLPRMEAILDNLRAALAWCSESPHRLEPGLRLAGLLPWFWFLANRWHEGRRWAETFLLAPGSAEFQEARALALFAAGGLSIALDDYGPARSYLQEALSLFQSSDDYFHTARTLNVYGIALLYQGELEHAIQRFDESLALLGADEDRAEYLWTLEYKGQAQLAMGEYEQAYATFLACLELNQLVGYTISLPQTLIDMARVQRCRGDLDSATHYLEQCWEFAEQFDILRFQSQALSNFGWIALERNSPTVAYKHFAASLDLYRRLADRMGIAEALEGLAVVADARGDTKEVVHLLDESASLRRETRIPVPGEYRMLLDQIASKADG